MDRGIEELLTIANVTQVGSARDRALGDSSLRWTNQSRCRHRLPPPLHIPSFDSYSSSSLFSSLCLRLHVSLHSHPLPITATALPPTFLLRRGSLTCLRHRSYGGASLCSAAAASIRASYALPLAMDTRPYEYNESDSGSLFLAPRVFALPAACMFLY